MALAERLLTCPHMELNVPVVKQDGELWFIEVPAHGGRVQRFRCHHETHARRFLAVFQRADRRRKPTARAGWPYSM